MYKKAFLCSTHIEFLKVLLSKSCQDFPPHPIPLPRLRGRGEGEGVISLVLLGCGYAALRPLLLCRESKQFCALLNK